MSRQWRPEKEGDIHPSCGNPVERRENMFALDEHRWPGLVCRSCKALWVVPTEETIFDFCGYCRPGSSP